MKTICQLISDNNDPVNSPRYYTGSRAIKHQGKFPDVNLDEVSEHVMMIKTDRISITEKDDISNLIYDMIGILPYFKDQRYPHVYILDEEQLAILILAFT